MMQNRGISGPSLARGWFVVRGGDDKAEVGQARGVGDGSVEAAMGGFDGGAVDRGDGEGKGGVGELDGCGELEGWG